MQKSAGWKEKSHRLEAKTIRLEKARVEAEHFKSHTWKLKHAADPRKILANLTLNPIIGG